MKTTDVFNMLVQSGLFAVLLGVAVSGVKCAKAYIDTKTAEATSKIKDANVKNAVSSAEDCVTTVVLEFSQTVADDLKAKSADGKLTAEDAAQIKADAVTKVQALLSDDVTNTLNTVFGDGEAWVKSKIEAAVKRLKGSTVTGTALLQSTAKELPAEKIVTPTEIITIPATDSSAQAATPVASEASSADASATPVTAVQNITVSVPANATAEQVMSAVQQAQAQ